MRKFKRIIGIGLAFAVLLGLVPTMGLFSQNVNAVVYAKQFSYEYYYRSGTSFISAMCSGYDGDDLDTVQSQMREAGWTPFSLDTAQGIKSADYTTLGYRTTTDPAKAITGAIFWATRSSTTENPQISDFVNQYGDIVHISDFYEVNIVKKSVNGIDYEPQYRDGHCDLNGGGSGANWCYFYVTRNAKAGPPVTNIGIYDSIAQIPSGYKAVASIQNPSSPCDTTGGKGNDKYVAFYSSVENLDSSVLRSRALQAESYLSSQNTAKYTSASIATLRGYYNTAVSIIEDLNADGRTLTYNQTAINNASANLLAGLNSLQTNVYFNANGGQGAPSAQAVTIGTDSTAVLDVTGIARPTREGYTFDGWSLASNASQGATTEVTVGFNQTLYAVWVKNAVVNFWKIDGSSVIAETVTAVVRNDQDYVTVTASQPTTTVLYDGRTMSWLGFTTATTADDSTPYSPSLTHNINGSVNFNSLYSGNVAIQFNANGGTNAPSQQSTKQYINANSNGITGNGASFTLSSVIPQKSGYTFAGWALTHDASTALYYAGDTISNVVVTTTLYAVWIPNMYYVRYNGGGASSGSMQDSIHYFGIESPLTKNSYVRDFTVTYHTLDGRNATADTASSTFLGWSTTSSGTVSYSDEQTVLNLTRSDGATVNLYARWDSGSVILPEPSRTGYNFRGWYTNSSLTNLAGNAGETYTPRVNTNLYAMWEANSYKVFYNGNGATEGATPVSDHVYDTTSALNMNGYAQFFTVTFDYNGATGGETPINATAVSSFAGWAESADGDAIYYDGENVRNLAENGVFVLYAKWVNGSVVLPTPVKDGCTFGGWFRDESLTIPVGSAGTVYIPGENVTIFAKWDEQSSPKLVPSGGSTAVVNETNGFIYGLPCRDELPCSDLMQSGLCSIADGNGYVTYEYSNEDNVIGTGTRVILHSTDGTVLETYTVVIFGDNNGDGFIDLSDCVDFEYFNAYMDSEYDYDDLSIANVIAMDLDGDGFVTSNDLLTVAYYAAYMIDEIDQSGSWIIA